jgi:hypothetical protein
MVQHESMLIHMQKQREACLIIIWALSTTMFEVFKVLFLAPFPLLPFYHRLYYYVCITYYVMQREVELWSLNSGVWSLE